VRAPQLGRALYQEASSLDQKSAEKPAENASGVRHDPTTSGNVVVTLWSFRSGLVRDDSVPGKVRANGVRSGFR